MNYQPKKFDHLLGLEGLEDFSDRALKNHFTLYEGYVNNVNKLSELTKQLLEQDKAATPEFGETTRRFGWEFNGMRLHEIYFGGLIRGGLNIEMESPLAKKIAEEFGSFEKWEKHFRSVGAMRGIGWAILYLDQQTGRLFNVWINEHDQGHFAGAVPILVMDVFEHAYMIDYDTKRVDYIEAYFKVINWHAASLRFDESQMK